MNNLFAGAAHVDITPELGHNLAGWIDVRPAARKVTPIQAHALAIAIEQTRVVIVSCDLLWLGKDLLQRIEDRFQSLWAIAPENIFILPTHNHFGPSVTGSYADDTALTNQETVYKAMLIDQLARAVGTALDNLRPARLGIGTSEEPKYSHNSRFWRKDGSINWLGRREIDFAKESGLVDRQVGVLRIFDEQEHTIATLYNFACHANAAEEDGFSAISWDWPGYTSQAVERGLGGEALFLVGACGNVHPIREGIAKEMGESIAGVVLEAVRGSQTIDPISLSIHRQEMTIPARDFRSFDPQQIESICSQMADEETRAKLLKIFMGVLDSLKDKENPDLVTQLRVIVLGNLALVFIPGEYFTELGLEIKQRSPFAHTFVIESLGESLGYLPTQKAYAEGGYQPAVGTRAAPGSGELIVERSLAVLEEVIAARASGFVWPVRVRE